MRFEMLNNRLCVFVFEGTRGGLDGNCWTERAIRQLRPAAGLQSATAVVDVQQASETAVYDGHQSFRRKQETQGGAKQGCWSDNASSNWLARPRCDICDITVSGSQALREVIGLVVTVAVDMYGLNLTDERSKCSSTSLTLGRESEIDT